MPWVERGTRSPWGGLIAMESFPKSLLCMDSFLWLKMAHWKPLSIITPSHLPVLSPTALEVHTRLP